jgi:hypothetical protein
MDRHSDGHHVVDIQLGCTNGAGESADGKPGGSDLNAPASPPPASKEGNVASNWYHGDMVAYTHDEEQGQEARDDDCEKPEPRYYVWVRAPSK